ncbi:MAG: PorT family protein [Bacteroidetes bacterium]|nr:PorT family protein [Bacteroidota bacterium]
MKKILLIISAVLIVTTIQAQFHFGPQIGYTASKLTTNTSDVTSSVKNNFLFGAFVRLGEKIYVQPEVNWLTQGGIWENTEGTGIDQVTNRLTMTYKTIQIPVSLGWRIIDLKIANIRIFGGMAANIATDKVMKINDITQPIDDADWKSVVWQYQVGAGVDVLMFALDVKYMGGLNTLNKQDFVWDGTSLATKSNMFTVTLGWKIF